MKRSVLIYLLFVALMCVAKAQEVNCSVSVSSAQVQGTNRQVFDNIRNAITDFLKTQKFTNDVFQNNERIECSLNFNITQQVSANEFKATLTVQLRRPVWGSAYSTTIFNMQDADVQFQYNEGQALTFNPSSYDQDNLVPVIAFYIYYMLGLDYDTFSPNGGTEWFKMAEQIVNQAQSAKFSGWKSFESTKNRYWLINNILDSNHSSFRTELYNYHRLGLDQMSEHLEQGRGVILTSIEKLRKVKQNASRNAYLLGIYFSAKADEIVGIFSGAPQIDQNRVVDYLQTADPGNMNKYNKIKGK